MGQKYSKSPHVDARYLAPQKLYCYNEVDLRKLRRLIKDKKLAPCFPGVDSETRELEDCPICFLKFPSINRAVCCHKPICTECFLQVKSQQAGHCPKCPYCKADFSIYYHGPASAEQKVKILAEEQQEALAAKRAQQEEQRRSQQSHERCLPAVPCCPASHESSLQTDSGSQAKMAQQTHAALQQYKDFLPDDLPALAETFHYDIDLNEVMYMQGLCASLQPPENHALDTSSIPADHGGHQTASIPIPAHTASHTPHSTRHSRASLGMGLSQAESIQPRPYWQPAADNSVTSSATATAQCHTASSADLASQASSSARQPDGAVQITVRKAPQFGSVLSEASSSAQYAQPPAKACQAARSISRAPFCSGSKPHFSSEQSEVQCSCSGRADNKGRSGVGDSLAGFLHDQARAGQMGSQALRPQPASGTHELIVGMVLTEFTFVPTVGSHMQGRDCKQVPVRPQPEKQDQDMASGLPCLRVCAAAAVGVGQTPAGDARSSPGTAHADLTGGAVLLQNPDDSMQYVMLTTDEQKAVQLSLQAQEANRCEQLVGTDTYQVECSPEDKAVQEIIAHGDAILKRLYHTSQDRMQELAAPSACSISSHSNHKSGECCEPQTDPLLTRMEDVDARLRALYSAT